MTGNFNPYLNGDLLYGDDFSPEQIQEWYSDEAEGYAELGANDRQTYSYAYHASNVEHGFRWLDDSIFESVLGLGSAYGDEFAPIANRCKEFAIIEPSGVFHSMSIFGRPAKYLKPCPDGVIDLPSQSQNLAVSFGALHHIPNVSFVVGEIARVLAPGCFFLVREPIVSMGDWNRPRKGLTRRERGIPYEIMLKIAHRAGFYTRRATFIDFPPFVRVARLFGLSVHSSKLLVKLDALTCRLFKSNVSYHATSFHHKFRPTSSFWVFQKLT